MVSSSSSSPGGPEIDVRVRRPALPADPPTRRRLECDDVRWLKRGGPTKADLKVVDLDPHPVVVKDFRHKAPWVRWIGRLQIGREWKAYRRLGPRVGLPRPVGRVDRHALAVEWIDGAELAFLPDRREGGAARLAMLRQIVGAMHASGLVHLDLRSSDNVLLGRDGQVYVIDLASAIRFRPGSLWHRLLFDRFAAADRMALLKWKEILGAGPFTPEEQASLARYRRWRALWIFNPKRPRY
jgi:serine/threonine protein kinase